MRRVPGNVVGPLLIVWSGTIAYWSIREEIGPALFGGFTILYILLGLIAYPLLTGGEVLNPGDNLFSLFFYLTVGLFPPVAIAASFTPLRKSIQERIDRHFYRHKYNAEKVLASFSATLRDELDLDHLTNSILEVVEETIKPAHVSLWFREVDLQPRDRQLKENASHILSSNTAPG